MGNIQVSLRITYVFTVLYIRRRSTSEQGRGGV
jgi:hypothetical protein